ncbi:AAA domain-containing protein [Ditylenchus destructor]|uniref:AAA domain-containing protein n=1 Tax=Ditylenchus destructor TaxID=166010 RepID=A0AAD4N9C8_9BILA|nr:AAA domain-containing protein [Ditylenchus destructor]
MADAQSERGGDVRILPGGLAIVFPVPNVVMPPVFLNLVEVNFKVDQLTEDLRDQGQVIIAGLGEVPNSLSAFVAQQRMINYLRWCVEKNECEIYSEMERRCDICRDCSVRCVEEGAIYEVQLSSEFCDRSDIRYAQFLMLEHDTNPRANVEGRIENFDPENNTVRFVTTGPRQRVPKDDTAYNVRLNPSSFAFRSCNRTLNFIVSLEADYFVFPQASQNTMAIDKFEDERKKFFDTTAFSSSKNFNDMQKRAIYTIVSGHHGHVPFLLHGPPGTGKTTVLVEATRLLALDKSISARILVCTPSNTAADLFTSELLKTGAIPAREIFRMYSLMHPVNEGNPGLLNVMCICEDEHGLRVFGIPSKNELAKFSVIICTLSASTYLVSGAMYDKFTHIFIDEAGQADELETLIPLAGLASSNTRVVLAGDPRQLGPVETVEYLNSKNITYSLMERFSKMELYTDDRRFGCMLEENYRSHPSILKVPSELFYSGRVRSGLSSDQKHSLCDWAALPKKGFPILWHDMRDKENREQGGTSYSNLAEVDIVADYVHQLVDAGLVKPAEIGVISPYSYQVRLLRHKLSKFPQMTIDSVERFQGSERRVIIVSTVRNNMLGFLNDDKVAHF